MSVLVLGLVFALPVFARAPEVAASGADVPKAEQIDVSDLSRLRTLPLLQADGIVAVTFPRGEGLDDSEKVQLAAQELAEAAGISEVIDQLWSVMPEAVNSGFMVNDDATYPYKYPVLESFEAAITDDVVKEYPKELLELVNLLALAAGTVDDSNNQLAGAGAAAQVIAHRLASSGGCHAALTEAWLVGLGESPDPEVYGSLFSSAIKECPEDPTPRWLWGQRIVEDSVRPALMVGVDQERSTMLAVPLDFFANWKDEQPISGLARLGEADTLLTQADLMARIHVMPFTVRSHAERALSIYRSVIKVAKSSPSLRVNEARALHLLDDPAAVDVIENVVREAPKVDSFRQWEAAINESEGNFDVAASAYGASVELSKIPSLVFSYAEWAHPTWLGSQDARAGQILDATIGGWGAGEVDWLGFIPDNRMSASEIDPNCRVLGLKRTLALAGQIPEALAASGEDQGRHCYEGAVSELDPVLQVLGGTAVRADEFTDMNGLVDRAQDLLRYGKNLKAAATLTKTASESSGDPLLWQRLGEIRYLSDDANGAIEALNVAVEAPVSEELDGWRIGDHQRAALMQGLALERAGKVDQALLSYKDASSVYASMNEAAMNSATATVDTSAAAELRMGSIYSARKNTKAALPHLRRAVEFAEENDAALSDPLNPQHPMSSGAEYNNLAVALLEMNEDPQEAVEFAEQALAFDPESPIFQETVAQALEASGKIEESSRAYEKAQASDATLYQTKNNLGVIEGKKGNQKAAVKAFTEAVQAKPDYALAWFNMGAVLSESSRPSDFLRSQGALAKSVMLDRSFRGAKLRLTADRSSVSTGVDISRTVDRDWKFSDTASQPAQGLTLMILLMALFRLAFTLGVDRIGEGLTSRILAYRLPMIGRMSIVWNRVSRFVDVRIGIAATATIAAWSVVQSGTGNRLAIACAAAVGLSLTWLYTVARPSFSAKAIQRRGWLPAIVLGTATSAVGYTFVPVPTTVDEEPTGPRRWIGAVVLCVIALCGLGLAFAFGTPFVRSMGLAAIAMLTVALLPLRPFDGSYLNGKRNEWAVSVGLVAITAAVALGLF